jgi:hypothetical protein
VIATLRKRSIMGVSVELNTSSGTVDNANARLRENVPGMTVIESGPQRTQPSDRRPQPCDPSVHPPDPVEVTR